MKKTRLKQLGKVGKRNQQANPKIDKHLVDHNIRFCEIRIPGVCLVDSFLQRVHRHKRRWYYPKDRKHLLYAHNQVLLGCQACHAYIENNAELTRKVFLYLRGEDDVV